MNLQTSGHTDRSCLLHWEAEENVQPVAGSSSEAAPSCSTTPCNISTQLSCFVETLVINESG